MTLSSTTAALISTGLISLAPNLILLLFPNYAASTGGKRGSIILSLGQALAAGGLLGDVFLHSLPESMESGGGEKAGLIILIGFLVFLVFDVIVRSVGDDHHHHHEHEQDGAKSGMQNGTHNKPQMNQGGMFTHTVILNLTADALHNFTDGLAIGASFASSKIPPSTSFLQSVLSLLKSRGGVATLSVFLHEIPHELGDFAILVNAGFSKSAAITAQFVTAIAAFLGTIAGLVAMHVEGLEHAMIPFTAGGFVYLAAVSILPEVLEEKAKMGERILQVGAFCVGIGFMLAVSILEHEEEERHGHVSGGVRDDVHVGGNHHGEF